MAIFWGRNLLIRMLFFRSKDNGGFSDAESTFVATPAASVLIFPKHMDVHDQHN